MIHQLTQLVGAPREVDIAAIERELTRLWKEAPDGDDTAQTPPVVRACALNLAVLTESEESLIEIEEMVGEVTAEHPARLFLIVADRAATMPSLEARISARCSIPTPGGKQVCCEQINLTARGSDVPKLSSIVTSLLVSDVPGVLLLKTPLRENDPVLVGLAEVLDRIVIDSSEAPAAGPLLLAWHAFLQKHRGRANFGDLAWTHLTAWRSVIAGAFNPLPMRPKLREIRSVTISYSGTRHPQHSGESQSLLLAAWLACKLNWMPLRRLRLNEPESSATLTDDKREITLQIRRTHARDGFPGGIESVAIDAAGTVLQFNSTRHQHCVEFVKQEAGRTETEMLIVLADRPEATLVAQELEILSRDAGYESALHKLISMTA